MRDSDLYNKIPFFAGSDVIIARNGSSSSYPFENLRGSSRGISGGDMEASQVFTYSKQYKGHNITSRSGDGSYMIVEVNDLKISAKIRPKLHQTMSSFDGALTKVLDQATIDKEKGKQAEEVLSTKEREAKQEIIDKGKEYTMSTIVQPDIIEEDDVILDFNASGSIQDQFANITGNISDLTRGINADTILGDLTTISETFKKTKAELMGLASTPVPKGMFGSWGASMSGMVKKNRFLKGMATSYEDSKTMSKSVQENIDYLFGLVHIEYEKLVTTGESLQHTKIGFKKQIAALETILEQSQEDLDKYDDPLDIPMRTTLLHTQIATSAEKYRQRLTKIEGAILATQHTIMVLGKELPAQKSDLIDEMAIGSLLGSVDKYQKMYGEIAELVGEVTENTAAATHQAVENLLELQINDTHTIEYIKKSASRGEDFKAMVKEKIGKLETKITADAKTIATITSSSNLLTTKETMKQLS